MERRLQAGLLARAVLDRRRANRATLRAIAAAALRAMADRLERPGLRQAEGRGRFAV